MINRRALGLVVLALALVVAAHAAGAGAGVGAASERIFGGLSSGSDVFNPATGGVLLQTGEGESAVDADEIDAEAEAEADAEDAESEADSESESQWELVAEGDEAMELMGAGAQAEAEAVEASEELAFATDADAFDLDVAVDEQSDAESDAEAQFNLQNYAELQGATDAEGEADADADADADDEIDAELDAFSAEAALADAEADAAAEFGVGAEAAPSAVATAGAAGKGHGQGKGKGKRGKGKGKGKGAKKPHPGMRMSQLNLRDTTGKGAKINLAQGKGRYSMGVNAAGVFSIDMEGRSIMSVSGKTGMLRARGDVTVWNTLRAGSLTLNQVPQWKMVRHDSFDKFVALPKRPAATDGLTHKHAGKTHAPAAAAGAAVAARQVSASDVANAPKPPAAPAAEGSVATVKAAAAASAASAVAPAGKTNAEKLLEKKARGWLYDDVIRCNGLSMLSAKPGRTVSTKYRKLPAHTQVRVTATVHFIDDWQGETGWLKLNDAYVWTESHDQKAVSGKFSVCGSDLYPESRFAAPIEVVWPHKARHLTLSIGSNLDDGSDARFAVSNVALYTRDTRRKKRANAHAKRMVKKCSVDPKTKRQTCKMVPAPKACKKGKDASVVPIKSIRTFSARYFFDSGVAR